MSVPKLYLVIANISKSANVRSLLLEAVAFGCHGVLIVGQIKNLGPIDGEKGSLEGYHDAKLIPIPVQEALAAGTLQLLRFAKWRECAKYLKENGIRLIGVEIDESSIVLDGADVRPPLDGDTALVMGNEGSGLHPTYARSCDGLVMLAQYGSGTASFNVSVAASMVLYRFRNEQDRQRREMASTNS